MPEDEHKAALGDADENTGDSQSWSTWDQKVDAKIWRCARFRYDEVLQQRLKTVELIVERTKWIPPAPRYPLDTLVLLHIEAADMRERSMAKAAGGKWNPEKQLWYIRYGNILGTPLEKHIHVDTR